MLIVLDPESEWKDDAQVAERIGDWTKERGESPRLYPGSLIWCAKKPGRELREKVELWLAWRRVAYEVRRAFWVPSSNARTMSKFRPRSGTRR